MAFILIFMMALAIVDTIILLVVLSGMKRSGERFRSIPTDMSAINNRLDCLDNQGHLFIKKLESLENNIIDIQKHCSMVMDIEKAKVKALETTRRDIAAEHQAICSGIEDRYNMIYEEFKGIRDIMVNGGMAKGGQERKTKADDVKKKKAENMQLARTLKDAGKTNAEIAKELGVAESTVRTYLKQPGIISPDEEDHLGAPQIDDPAGYQKFVNRIVDENLNKKAVNGKTVDRCPFDDTHGECDSACSDACHDCVVSARAFNLLD